MFVAFAIEGFAEVERLFPCTELDLHGPAGGSDFRGGTHGDEAAVFALLADANVEVDDIFAIAFEAPFLKCIHRLTGHRLSGAGG